MAIMMGMVMRAMKHRDGWLWLAVAWRAMAGYGGAGHGWLLAGSGRIVDDDDAFGYPKAGPKAS